ncbi:cupin, partial [Burkholderia cenocepacia]|uniref:cupin n=1 Tax=Burkholderia cenocepacia TaxID=95486 RepID=UPI00406C8EE6
CPRYPNRWRTLVINPLHTHVPPLDMHGAWRPPEGYHPRSGAQGLLLSGALGPGRNRASRPRLLRLPAGLHTQRPFVHDYWEEVFLVEGALTVGNDEHGNGGAPFEGYTYALRPPGAWHGPLQSNCGRVLPAIHHYAPA